MVGIGIENGSGWLWIAQAAAGISAWASAHAQKPHASVEERIEDVTEMVRQPRLWSLTHPLRAIRRKMAR